MNRLTTFVLTVGIMSVPMTATALAFGGISTVEGARYNAQAGGPISELDKDMLQRYGYHGVTPEHSSLSRSDKRSKQHREAIEKKH